MRNWLRIAAGVAGTVTGYVATVLLLGLVGFGNRADPIMSGLIGMLVIAPAGAIAGLVLAIKLATPLAKNGNSESLARSSLKALGLAVLLCTAAGTAYYVYAVTTAMPWLNPNGVNPLLLFEVRLPAGTAVPTSARGIVIELQTDLNTMPGEPSFSLFRRDGDRAVIAGEVELAFRTSYRQLAVNIKGQPDRLYPIALPAKAPHAAEFGPWQSQADGSEIRYRPKWPGKN